MSTDHRQQAKSRIEVLVAHLRTLPPDDTLRALIAECESLVRAIAAFHMEGIRFRMYNVDRLLHRSPATFPAPAVQLFNEARQELEAAGFHTRSHQAPG
ncbi:MAG TPA: hypothetical protein VD833_20035 [Vicinamibacterales bacterium]|nr:hypothetical protein [Vicinamibacterales bacterium]